MSAGRQRTPQENRIHEAGLRDLHHYDADPRYAKVREGLLSKEYAKERAKLIDPDKAIARCRGTPPMSDTTYLTAVIRSTSSR